MCRISRVNGAPVGGGAGCVVTDPVHAAVATDTRINGANLILTHDAGLAAGHLMLMAATMNQGANLPDWSPLYNDGWALIAGLDNAGPVPDFWAGALAKKATAADVAAGSTTIPGTLNAADACCGAWIRITGAGVAVMPSCGEAGIVADNTTPYTSGSIETGDGGLAYYFCAVDDSVVITVPGTLVSDFAISSNDTLDCALAGGHKVVAGGGLTGVESFTTPFPEDGTLFTVMVQAVST